MFDQNKQILLSIVIPTYNRAKYLERCLESVTSHQGDFFEIVVSDNASPDNTQEVVQKFLSDTRIRYVRNNKNLGARENIYKATQYSQGQFIFWLSDDDYLLHGALDKVLSIINHYSDIGYIYSPVITVDDRDGKVFWRKDDFGTNTLINTGLQSLTSVMSSSWVFSRQILRRDLIDWKTWDIYKENAYFIIIVAGRIMLKSSAYYISEDLVIHTYYNKMYWEEYGDSQLEIELRTLFDYRNCMRAVLHDYQNNKEVYRIVLKWENDAFKGWLDNPICGIHVILKQLGWYRAFHLIRRVYKPSFILIIKIFAYLLISLLQALRNKTRIRSRLKNLIGFDFTILRR